MSSAEAAFERCVASYEATAHFSRSSRELLADLFETAIRHRARCFNTCACPFCDKLKEIERFFGSTINITWEE